MRGRGAWLLLLLGCNDPAASRAASELSATGSDREATEAPMPDDAAEPRAAIDALAKRYAAGLVPDAELIEGELRAQERRDYLAVLKAGACYRVVGASEATLSDFDLALFDPSGALLTEDPGQDRYPVLGLHSDICPVQAGSYRVQASAYAGAGRFALRVFRTPQ
jgi:hypothetical protein